MTNIKLPENISSSIKHISLDKTSGAYYLSKKAAEIIIMLLKKEKYSSSKLIKKMIKITALNLVNSQPMMAPIFNLVNRILLDIETINSKEKIIKKTMNNCNDFIKNLELSVNLISDLASNLIKENSKIIVHSNSDTLYKTLIKAQLKNIQFDVFCTESRPMNEGVLLAERLGKNGIKTNLVVDSAIFSYLKNADFVFVGADALHKKGLINKIGTLGLALSSKKLNVKIYSLCSSLKILPTQYNKLIEDNKDRFEICNRELNNVNIINYYYDLTDLNYFTGIILENGIKDYEEISNYINNLKIHIDLI